MFKEKETIDDAFSEYVHKSGEWKIFIPPKEHHGGLLFCRRVQLHVLYGKTYLVNQLIA
jgi:hypothetical protein